MKYTAIFTAAMGLLWIWRFISAVMERGLPTHPVYYISAAIGVYIGYLTYRLTKKKITKRRYVLIPVSLTTIAIAFNVSGVEILRQIGGGLFFWYLLSGLGFYEYLIIRQWSSKKEITESQQMIEDVSKGISLLILVFALIFAPFLVFIFLMMLLS